MQRIDVDRVLDEVCRIYEGADGVSHQTISNEALMTRQLYPVQSVT